MGRISEVEMMSPKGIFEQALQLVHWQAPQDFSFPDTHAKQWLTEEASLSRRLSECCNDLSVELLNNQRIQPHKLSGDEKTLLADEPSLLREVILRGDREDWLYGRTIIPQSSLSAQPYDLENQGDRPLGLTVFNTRGAFRDALQVGVANVMGQKLLARRSRLWMNQRPMLVAEIFLCASPAYLCQEFR